MIKSAIIKRVVAFNYPQRVFANAIKRYIDSHVDSPSLIVDCPCGNGETSCRLASVANCGVLAADRSAECIATANAFFKKTNLRFVCANLTDMINIDENISVFCIINSLFLLPDAEQLLQDLHRRIKKDHAKLLVVIPNTSAKNFSWFQKHYPAKNKLIVPQEQIRPFFENFGFTIETVKPLAFAHHLGRRDLRLFSGFWPFYLHALNVAQRVLGIGKPNYFFIALSA